jgi:hypothetical protein
MESSQYICTGFLSASVDNDVPFSVGFSASCAVYYSVTSGPLSHVPRLWLLKYSNISCSMLKCFPRAKTSLLGRLEHQEDLSQVTPNRYIVQVTKLLVYHASYEMIQHINHTYFLSAVCFIG